MQSTNWPAVWVLYLAGCTLALHVGKLPAALPLLVQEYNMSLVESGTLVSFYAVLIALGGLICGIFVARIGYTWFAVVGIGLCVLGSFAGVYSVNVRWLMLTRALEGLGWIMGVVAIPVLMSTLSVAKDRPVVMGLWGAFMAVGSCTMLLLSPYLHDAGGWRYSWIVAGGLSAIGTVAAFMVCHQQRELLSELRSTHISLNFSDLMQRRALAVFLCFLCYSIQYVAVTSFLPSLLVQDSGMLLSTATRWTALILLPNAIGNVSAGWFINRGYKRSNILALAALVLGLCSLVTFSSTDNSIRIPAAILLTGVGGVIPGALFSTAGLLASTASGAGMIIGFMLTGAGVGQMFGPTLITRMVDWSGHWSTGGIVCLSVGIAGALAARWLTNLPVVSRS